MALASDGKVVAEGGAVNWVGHHIVNAGAKLVTAQSGVGNIVTKGGSGGI